MTTNTSYYDNCTIYPGVFIPKIEPEDVAFELKKERKVCATEPLININELPDHFVVNASIPGVGTEDFFITVKNNIVNIAVIHNELETVKDSKGENYQLHEFDNHFFHRTLFLPGNVDADFVRAEYKEGVLKMILPKTNVHLRSIPLRIVVY